MHGSGCTTRKACLPTTTLACRRCLEGAKGDIEMRIRTAKLSALLIAAAGCALLALAPRTAARSGPRGDARPSVDQELEDVLAAQGFTGRIESTLEQRLGHRIDNQLADLGRVLFFDTVTGF